MKFLVKSNLILILLFVPLFLSAQAIFWHETFAVDEGNWELDSNWSIQYGTMQLNYDPTINNYDLSALSPIIDLPVNVGDIDITQWISTYSIVDEIADISVISSTSETVIWSYEMINGDWGISTGSIFQTSLSQFAGSSIRLRFRSYGSSTWNFNNWDIYDIKIYAMSDNDLAAVKIVGPPNAEQNVEDQWSVKIRNVGMNVQDNYTVKIYHESEEIAFLTSSETIAANDELLFPFNWTPEVIGNTYLWGEVILENDDFLSNNVTAHFNLYVYEEGSLQILLWDLNNNSHVTDPETENTVGCEYGLQQALSANSSFFVTVTELPDILYNYDIIFATLGLYCVG